MNLQNKINALPLSDRESIARQLDTINNWLGLTERERQREQELLSAWVSRMCQNHDAMLKERSK